MLASPLGASEFVLGTDKALGDIIIVGEIHDNQAHHLNQASIITEVAPKAIVFEMLDLAQAERVMSSDWSTEAELEAVLDWNASGWPDFSIYFPVFAASPSAEIFGAALPVEEVRSAIGTGAKLVFGAEAGRFGLASPLADTEQTEREKMQADVHCGALPPEMLPGMVEAQRLRDAHFARLALQALQEAGGPVVVIAGNGHARTDWGMPRAIKTAAPDVDVLAIGQVTATEQNPPYDRWIVGPELGRADDPCDAFRSN